MNVTKPRASGILTRTFEHDRRCWLVVSPIVVFSFDGFLGSETDLWNFASDTPTMTPLDRCMPKVGAEILLASKAFAPRGGSVPAVDVRVTLGPVDKRLRVVGDRVWDGARPSVPLPFTEMDIDATCAYGGEGFDENPKGKGYIRRFESAVGRSLPNVEDPREMITSPSQRARPAGFGPQDIASPDRRAKAGTYDGEWFKTQFPGLARDVDWSMFNVAPSDQQLPLLRGDEAFHCENLHPSKPTMGGRLPSVAARVFLQHVGTTALKEVPSRIDTVWLVPHHERGVVIFRALAEVREDDAADIGRILVALEDIADSKTVAHYEHVLRQRTTASDSRAGTPDDTDLLPLRVRVGNSSETGTRPVDPLKENMRRRTAAELRGVRERLAKHGLDPAKVAPPPTDPPMATGTPSVVDIDARIEAARKTAEAKKLEARQALEAICAKAGVKPPSVDQRSSGEPPDFSAARQIGHLANIVERARAKGIRNEQLESLVNNPSYLAKLLSVEAQLRRGYSITAQFLGPARRRSRAESEKSRAYVSAARASRQSLAKVDFTGTDFSGLDLSSVDFREALLDNADLSNCNLTGTILAGAVLAHADLRAADLSAANFHGANLGHTRLLGARAEKSDFSEAILVGADLTRTNCRGATFERADLATVVVSETDFENARLDGVSFSKTSLKGARFVHASMIGATLNDVDAVDVDFSDACLRGVSLVRVTADRAIFRRGMLEGARAAQGSSFNGACFEESNTRNANFRGAMLRDADFTRADTRRADFSEADLRGARFYRAVSNEARFVRSNLERASLVSANLMMAVLQKASLRGADFKGANLFRADLARVHVDDATSWKDAYLDQARVRPTVSP